MALYTEVPNGTKIVLITLLAGQRDTCRPLLEGGCESVAGRLRLTPRLHLHDDNDDRHHVCYYAMR